MKYCDKQVPNSIDAIEFDNDIAIPRYKCISGGIRDRTKSRKVRTTTLCIVRCESIHD